MTYTLAAQNQIVFETRTFYHHDTPTAGWTPVSGRIRVSVGCIHEARRT